MLKLKILTFNSFNMKKYIFLVIILFLSTNFFAQKGMSKNKKALIKSIEQHKNKLIDRIDVIATDHAPHSIEEKNGKYFSCGKLLSQSRYRRKYR